MIRNRCALRKIPTTSLALRSAAYQGSTFKKGCDDDDAAARTSLGFPPVCGREVGRGNPDAPQEGMVAPASVTASVSAVDKEFSRPPKSHGPGHSVMLRQPRRPPTRATTVTQPPPPSHRDPLTKTDETDRKHPEPRRAWAAATREGATSTASCGDRPDAATGANQAPLARPSPPGS
jgi:hypothetical protein